MSKLNDDIAVYQGSFDPVTNGHLWMIEEGSRTYEKVFVAVGTNPDKKSYFTVEERVEMLKALTSQFPNVEVDFYVNKFMVHYAREKNARVMLRGVRNLVDEAYERQMLQVNLKIDHEIDTVFVEPPFHVGCISSSLVKGSLVMDRWEEVVAKFVPELVLEKLKEKEYARRAKDEI